MRPVQSVNHETGRSILFATLPILLSSAARADERVLRFDAPDLPLWGTASKSGGEPVGIAPEFCRMLLDRAGLHGRIRVVPMEQLRAASSAPERDFLLLGLTDDNPPNGTSFLAELDRFTEIAVARPGIALHTRADLDRIGPIAFAPGGELPQDLRGDSEIVIQEVNSIDAGLRLLAAGRLNAVLGIDSAIDTLARQQGNTDLLGDRLNVTQITVILAASGEAANLPEAAALKLAATDLAASGAFDTIAATAFRAVPSE